MNKTASILTKAAYVIALLILCYLFLHCIHYTFSFDLWDYHSNHVHEGPDSRLKSAIVIAVTPVVFFFLGKLLFRKAAFMREKNKRVLFLSLFVSFVVFAICFAWVAILKVAPWYDQETVYHIAQNFNEKDYFKDVTQWLYLKQYPQEFGLVFIEAILLKIWNSFFFLQFLNALFVSLAVFFSCRVCYELTADPGASLAALVLTSVCFPLYYYVTYVYGDIFNIFAILFVTWLSIRWLKTENRKFIIIAIVMSIIMVPAKENSLIFLIALAIVFTVFALKKKKALLLIPAVLMLVLPILASKGTRAYYEHAAGQKIDNEIPSINWIVMGMRGTLEEGNGVGFFDGYVYWDWNLLHQDKEATKQKAYSDLNSFLETYKNDPGYAYRFYRYKALEQWAEPTFACIYMTSPLIDENWENMDMLYKEETTLKMQWFMNMLQTIVYFFSLVFFAVSIYKEKESYGLIIAVTFIGGFLFSLLWEAGGRYVFPYFVFLIPAAANGIGMTLNKCNQLYLRYGAKYDD